MPSCEEHLRQHGRNTVTDAGLPADLRPFPVLFWRWSSRYVACAVVSASNAALSSRPARPQPGQSSAEAKIGVTLRQTAIRRDDTP